MYTYIHLFFPSSCCVGHRYTPVPRLALLSTSSVHRRRRGFAPTEIWCALGEARPVANQQQRRVLDVCREGKKRSEAEKKERAADGRTGAAVAQPRDPPTRRNSIGSFVRPARPHALARSRPRASSTLLPCLASFLLCPLFFACVCRVEEVRKRENNKAKKTHTHNSAIVPIASNERFSHYHYQRPSCPQLPELLFKTLSWPLNDAPSRLGFTKGNTNKKINRPSCWKRHS